MNEEKKRQRLAELLGIEYVPEPTENERQEAVMRSREADATLLYIENSNGFKIVQCKHCEMGFAVNLQSVAYCSDNCREKALAGMGIQWNREGLTPEERWGRLYMPVPLIVPPPALALAREAVESLLASSDHLV